MIVLCFAKALLTWTACYGIGQGLGYVADVVINHFS